MSTPAGSTAYNLSVHGPILNLNSKNYQFHQLVLSGLVDGKENSKRSVKNNYQNLNPKKRPISAVADNIEVRNAKNVIVKTNKRIKFRLLYDKNRGLQQKIKIEQLRKETS